MDKEYFVRKVKFLCLQKGIKPTNACKESGVGGSFLSNIERGNIPTVTKVEKLAAYLGTTVSDLIGEEKPKSLAIPDQPYLVMRFNALSRDDQEEIMTLVDMKYHKALREAKEAEGKKEGSGK